MFDEDYKKKELLWGKEPSKIIQSILEYKQSGSVLDLGCGEGRNALFLAKKGFNVTGVDVSKEAIKKFKKWAESENLKVTAIAEDIMEFKFQEKYDVIISNSTLHFLDNLDIEEMISKMKINTSEGGLNVITAFTEENPENDFPYLRKVS